MRQEWGDAEIWRKFEPLSIGFWGAAARVERLSSGRVGIAALAESSVLMADFTCSVRGPTKHRVALQVGVVEQQFPLGLLHAAAEVGAGAAGTDGGLACVDHRQRIVAAARGARRLATS